MSNGEKVYQAEKIISISKSLFKCLSSDTLEKVQPYFLGESICPPKLYFERNDITEKLLVVEKI